MTATTPTSSKYQLVQDRIDENLAEYLIRADTAGISLRNIAADLTVAAGTHVSHESVRGWLQQVRPPRTLVPCNRCDALVDLADAVLDEETPTRAWCSDDCHEADQERAAEFIAS